MLSPALLTTGTTNLSLEAALVSRASVRCRFDHFAAPPDARASLTIELVEAIASPHGKLTALDREFGAFEITPTRVRVSSDGSDLASIATVRLGWHVAIHRAGGVLMHAGAVAFGERAVIATGVSGAGKTTLTSFLLQAGGTLLSDEIVALFPDGTVRGTPFRSDLDLPGVPNRFRIGGVLLLAKGAEERIDPVAPRELIHAAMSQAFTPDGAGLSRTEALARVTAAFSEARTGRLTFRKDAAAGRFVRDWLNATRE